MISLLYDTTLKQSLVDTNIDEKQANGFKRVHEFFWTKISDILKNTEFEVGDDFNYLQGKNSISPKQINKINSFQQK